MYPILKLKPQREQSITLQHPWVFSRAVEHKPSGLKHGDPVHLATKDGLIVATGTYSAHSQISVRIFDFKKVELNADWITSCIRAAFERRQLQGLPNQTTTGYRLLFGEADQFPGLIIDRYADTYVLQSSTAGSDKLLPLVAEVLISEFKANAIINRSDTPSRSEEELDPISEQIHGADVDRQLFSENGLKFVAQVTGGQKTGFYLDQRDLRSGVRAVARDRRILNLFANTGSVAVAALAGGAAHVLNVDSSEPSLALVDEHVHLNDLPATNITNLPAEIFDWISAGEKDQFDMVLLDPPALIKSHKDVEHGRKAYHFLNRAAMRLVKPGGIFVSSSCSAHFSEQDLVVTLRRSAQQNERRLHILRFIPQPGDHPISAYFPEGTYLKSFICRLD